MTHDSPWVSALLGHTVNSYVLEEHVGTGGFGMVFRARHEETDALVAIKILDPSRMGAPQILGEFQNEGVLLQKLLRRSHVIDWVDSGVVPMEVSLAGTPVPLSVSFHVMALASGGLDELTSDPANLASIPWDERIAHWRGAVLGVHQMHLSSVAHRDLKAANCLLLAGLRDEVQVRLTDLGRSKDFSLPPTLSPVDYLYGRGDLSHAAPEYLYLQGGSEAIHFRLADMYGLGSLLAELATGHSMTSLAVGSWRDMLESAKADYASGVQRNLSSLRPQFRRACAEAVEEVPPVIRVEVTQLLERLCDPVPHGRFQFVVGRANRQDGLQWLLKKADIVGRRLAVSERRTRYGGKVSAK